MILGRPTVGTSSIFIYLSIGVSILNSPFSPACTPLEGVEPEENRFHPPITSGKEIALVTIRPLVTDETVDD